MGGTVSCAADCSVHQDDRCSVIGSNTWRLYLTSILVLQIIVLDLAFCRAAELPTVAEISQDSAELRTASSSVQGEIRVFRSETVNPEALEKLPSEIGIPLILSGKLWCSKERFRADYKSLRPDSAGSETQHSVAVDDGVIYQLSSSSHPDGGILHVCDSDSPEAIAATKFAEATFYSPLDALWSSGGNAFVNLLQRPGTTIVPSQMFPGGYSLLVSMDDGSNRRYEFEAIDNHPLGYFVASGGDGNSLMKLERRVFSTRKEGRLYPVRVVDVATLGSGGYTEVVILDLEPLQADSPIANGMGSGSFRNIGVGYQVYNHRKSSKEEIAERYNKPVEHPPSSENNTFHGCFLWMNGCAIVTLAALLIYRRIRRKKGC